MCLVMFGKMHNLIFKPIILHGSRDSDSYIIQDQIPCGVLMTGQENIVTPEVIRKEGDRFVIISQTRQ